MSKVPTFGAAYAISIDSKVAPDSMMKYLQTNKPDNVNDFMFIRCRDGNDMLRRVVKLDVPLKHFFANYAADRDTSIKSLRIKQNDRTLFLSSIGQKTPLDLSMKDDDILDITIISHHQNQQRPNSQSNRLQKARRIGSIRRVRRRDQCSLYLFKRRK